MGNFEELHRIVTGLHEKKARILILDNNNIEFCCQHKDKFPIGEIFLNYDIVLVPEWVHEEISHSEHRLNYLAEIPAPLLVMDESEDYPKLINYQEYRLLHLFKYASNTMATARKVCGRLDTFYKVHQDLPEDWVAQLYESAFSSTSLERSFLDRGAHQQSKKKNAGETSILVLAYLLCHRYGEKLNHVTIFSSDKGSLTIKQTILDNLEKIGLVSVFSIPISFKSTDVLLMEAVSNQWINLADIPAIRRNPKTVIYTSRLDDSSSYRHAHVMDTAEFMSLVQHRENYHVEF